MMERFKVLSPLTDKKIISDFYVTHARAARVEASDFVLGLFKKNKLIALVRISSEEEIFVLRSMQVHSDFQRQNFGTKLLNELETYILKRNFTPLYCIPYGHLEKFYGQIGFKTISENESPFFLQERVKGYRQRNPQSQFCIMKK